MAEYTNVVTTQHNIFKNFSLISFNFSKRIYVSLQFAQRWRLCETRFEDFKIKYWESSTMCLKADWTKLLFKLLMLEIAP